MQSPKSLLFPFQSVLFSLRSFLAKEPPLYPFYLPFIWWDQKKQAFAGADPQQRIIDDQTELIIDGFQSSANSFASLLFQQSQKRDVKLAHHMHSPTQIIQGIKLNIPILITIREPMDTVLSLTTRWPYISVNQGLKSYIGFYEKIQPYTSDFIISSFEQTTQHLDISIEKINTKFNVNFDLVDIGKIKAETQVQIQKKVQNTMRERVKNIKEKEFALPKNKKLLAEAKKLYHSFEIIALSNDKEFTKKSL